MVDSFIDTFEENFSDKKPKQRRIGLELELPVVQRQAPHKAADITPILISYGQEHGWPLLADDTNPGTIVGFKDDDGRVVTPEFSVHVAEAALPPRCTLGEINSKDVPWLSRLREYFLQNDSLMLGFGTLPNTKIPEIIRTKRGRYRTLEEALTKRVRATGVTASTQVSIEVAKSEIALATNVCNALSPLSVAFSANSSVWKGKDSELLAVRESVWDIFAPGRSGMPSKPFESTEDYIERVFALDVLLERSGSEYTVPQSAVAFGDRVKDVQDVSGAWKMFEGTIWWNARPRSPYGTIEIRPNCTQPHKDMLAIPAFWLGIIENLQQASELVKALDWSQWRALRHACVKYGMHASVDGRDAHMLSMWALSIAEEGLKQRGNGEEVFLEPLWERWDMRRTPAEEARDVFKDKGMEALVEHIS